VEVDQERIEKKPRDGINRGGMVRTGKEWEDFAMWSYHELGSDRLENFFAVTIQLAVEQL